MWTALSQDESLLAAIPPLPLNRFLSVPLYQADTSLLQSTLTCKLSEEETIKGLVFCGSEHLCVLLSSRQQRIVVWNVKRGVIVHTLELYKYAVHKVMDSTTSSSTPLLSLLVSQQHDKKHQKVHVHLYNVATGKCVRKIKCGKHKNLINESPAAACFKDDMVALVEHEKKPKLKLVSLQDGSKQKHKIKSMDLMEFSSDGTCLATASATTKSVHVLSIPTMEAKESPATVTIHVPDQPTKLVLIKGDTEELNLLVETANTHQAYLYRIQSMEGTIPKPTTVVSCLQQQSLVESSFYLTAKTSKLLTVMLGKEQTRVELLNYQDNDGNYLRDIKVGPAPQQQEEEEDDIGSKRKVSSSQTSALGPGQAGSEAHVLTDGVSPPPSKKHKKDNEEEQEDETIAQRLQRLTQEMLVDEDEDSVEAQQHGFNVKRVTTESLSKLLKQALTSRDDTMLELALQVQNSNIIQQTVSELNQAEKNQLFTKLTWRFASKPTRAAQLSTWLRLLLSGNFASNHEQEQLATLKPLRNLLQERVESFPHLLKLEGRLSLLGGGNM